MQHGDLDVELAHKGHVVLDHDDAVGAVDLAQQLGGLVRFGIGHAGDRLVHQQEARVLGKQHADLQPLLLTVAEDAGRQAPLFGEADGGEDRTRCVRRSSAVLRAKSENRGRRSPARARRKLSLDGVRLEDGGLLELSPDAEAGDGRLHPAG